MLKSRLPFVLGIVAFTVSLSSAQMITSAHSGTLHYFDGAVSIDGNPVPQQVSKFAEVKENSVLSTAQGRAEVLLTPGVFLRIGENSSIKMLDNRLISTRVEILSGSAIVESDDARTDVKDSPVTIVYKDYEIRLIKHGLFEISADPSQMRVYKGEAIVSTISGNPADRATVKEGKQLNFSAALLTENFNQKVGDDLYLWARDRSESISVANMSSASTLNPAGYGYSAWNSGYGYNGFVNGWTGGWYYNPYFNMYTFVPGTGTYWNAFGYGFFSPGSIYAFYSPSNYWYGGGGSRGVGSLGWSLPGIYNSASNRAAPLSNILPRNSGGLGFGGGSPRGFGSNSSGFGSNSSGFLSGGGGGNVASSSGSGGGFSGRSAGGIGGGGGHR